MTDIVHERETWSSKYDFILALMGFCVGFGNVWRFPYLCFKNGGGCFLIPYFICLILAGIPVILLETALGQYTSEGGVTAWNICPLFQGIGYASVAVLQYINIYYNVILAWSLYYMFASFRSHLPWSHCDNPWNTPNCFELNGSRNVSRFANSTATNASKMVSASQEFWEYKVLKISNGLGELGAINWDLALCLLLAWFICYLCVFKGVKSSGKVVYFTATAPYFVLTALFIRAVTLPGAGQGIKFYLSPDWSRLSDGQVWLDAGTQVFFSYCIGMSALIALGSYNKFKNNFYRGSVIYTVCNAGTSFYSGLLIFAVLGFMAKKQGVEVQNVARSGPGLAFIAYPEAVAQMPLAPLWSVLFFFMLILFGLDSEFVGIEAVVTAVVDLFPRHLRRGYRKELFTAFVCVVWFLIGLSMVTEGGIYVFQLFDSYSGSGSVLLLVVTCESIVIGWLYGRNRFYDDIECMLGFRIHPFIGWCWCIFTPMFCLFIFVFNLVTYSPLSYGSYVFPGWGMAIGLLLTLSSLSLIPAVMIHKLLSVSGTISERLSKLIIPVVKEKRDNVEMSQNDAEKTELMKSVTITTYHTV